MSSSTPAILGSDGQFRLYKDAMGVPGFHVAVNCFTDACHRRLFENAVFSTNTDAFVQDQPHGAPPLERAICHPTKPEYSSSPWPDDWHRVINAVRDCGLFPGAVVPDNAYGLTYRVAERPASHFPCHHDARGKWGEYVLCCSVGAPCTITFQHGAPKSKRPYDPSRPWDYVPPGGPYWTVSRTAEAVDMYRRRLWQVTMTLPPNSMYVMSGASRYDWRHGINAVPEIHPVPSVPVPSTGCIGATGTVTCNNDAGGATAQLYPSWNRSGCRRSIIFRSTKVFSDYCLEKEREDALFRDDARRIADTERRLAEAAKFKPEIDHMIDPVGLSLVVFPMRRLNDLELQRERVNAQSVIDDLGKSGVHTLRFDRADCNFGGHGSTRAPAVGGATVTRTKSSMGGGRATNGGGVVAVANGSLAPVECPVPSSIARSGHGLAFAAAGPGRRSGRHPPGDGDAGNPIVLDLSDIEGEEEEEGSRQRVRDDEMATASEESKREKRQLAAEAAMKRLKSCS